MTTMAQYLADIKYATDGLIPKVWAERNELKELETRLGTLTRLVQEEYRRARDIALDAEDSDDVGLATLRHWDNYFGDDKVRYSKEQERKELLQQIRDHQFAVASLSGSLLQYAKQGISIVHGDLNSCPDGRHLGSLTLKTVIWQGRNQSLHWEDGSFINSVTNCFNTLAAEVDPKFSTFTRGNLAFDVVELLGWTDWSKFESDMLLLA